jgi:hypothetical protein
MEWIALLHVFGCLFFCFGMVQQQQQELTFKEKFNFAYSLCVYHQRCLVVICRDRWGKNALGFPSALGLLMMVIWYMLSQDPFMLAWTGAWCIYQLKRRGEAVKLTGQVPSYSDGRCIDGDRFGMSEKTAKTVLEPIMFGLLGGFLYWVYDVNGWSVRGLPAFLLLGIFTLPAVEWAKQAAWERKLDALADSRMESESLMRDYQDKYGN